MMLFLVTALSAAVDVPLFFHCIIKFDCVPLYIDNMTSIQSIYTLRYHSKQFNFTFANDAPYKDNVHLGSIIVLLSTQKGPLKVT